MITTGNVTGTAPLRVRVRGEKTGQPATVGEGAPAVFAVGDVVVVLLDGGRLWVLDRLSDTTGWQTPTLQNGWTAFGGGQTPPRYRKTGGIVRLSGTFNPGSSGTAIFTLPVGFRTAFFTHVPCYVNGPNGERDSRLIHITPSGAVEFYSTTAVGLVCIDGITFVAEQ